MKVKSTIRLLDYSEAVFVGMLVLLGILLTRKSMNVVIIAIEVVFSCAAIILYLFRSPIANRILKKSAHPGLAYAVLEKMGFAESFDLSIPEKGMGEINNPTYSTETLIKENELRTHIDRELSFEEKGLQYKKHLIPWTSIYDWSYKKSSRYRSATISIDYYDADNNIQEDVIYLTFGLSAVNILLLLTHYHGKYGQIEPNKKAEPNKEADPKAETDPNKETEPNQEAEPNKEAEPNNEAEPK